jgi:8-amino-7-oxononanoate synthase
MTLDETIRARLEAIELRGQRRSLTALTEARGVEAVVDGRPVVVFCSNDYLGLRSHPAVLEAAVEATRRHGTGSGSSRLIAGTSECHEELEEALAETFGTEAALAFSSGYHANLAILTTLAADGDLLCSDTLNHASIVDGCRLSRAAVEVFAHGDRAALEAALGTPCEGLRWVVAEGLYSMDGDQVDLAGYADAADAAGAALLVDEAHSVGAIGPGGLGACEDAGITDRVFARMGTLGKSLGSHGAFVLCTRDVRELLVSSGRSLLYTTALPPATCAAARVALQLMVEDDARREALARNAAHLWRGVKELGLSTSPTPTAIVPAVVGAELDAVVMSHQLLERGYFARAIRPPTVPVGTSRLRFSVTAEHTPEQIDGLLACLAEIAPGLPLGAALVKE